MIYLVGQADDSNNSKICVHVGPFRSLVPCQLSCCLLILITVLGARAGRREMGGFNSDFQRCCSQVCRWWQQMTEMSSFSL